MLIPESHWSGSTLIPDQKKKRSSFSIKPSAHVFRQTTAITCLQKIGTQAQKQQHICRKEPLGIAWCFLNSHPPAGKERMIVQMDGNGDLL
jgi:hypothetical protein